MAIKLLPITSIMLNKIKPKIEPLKLWTLADSTPKITIEF